MLLQTSGVKPFIPEVRSWLGNDMLVNLHQTDVILSSDMKGQVPRHNFHPPRSRAWLRGGKAQLWLPQGQVSRPCLAVIAEGARSLGPKWPSGSSGCLDNRDWIWQDTVPAWSLGPPSSPAGPSLGELEDPRRRPGSTSYLTLHLMTTTLLTIG